MDDQEVDDQEVEDQEMEDEEMEDAESSSSSSSGEEITWPPGFPLDHAVYDQAPCADWSPPRKSKPAPNDPRRRDFESLYPIGWLVNAAPPASGTSYPLAPIGQLRTQWQQAFQQAANGAWHFVEYVPAWSDPDWSTRYTYTRAPGLDSGSDALARQYAKPGLLQTQRPALRAEDALLNPTAAAKRWGVYPFQAWEGLEGRFVTWKGWSGTTPKGAEFPTIALDQPRFSVALGRMMNVLTVADVVDERQKITASRTAVGRETSDDDFRKALRAVALDVNAEPARADVAGSMLALFESMHRSEERLDYQRLLFAGNTSNEVSWTHSAALGHVHDKSCTD